MSCAGYCHVPYPFHYLPLPFFRVLFKVKWTREGRITSIAGIQEQILSDYTMDLFINLAFIFYQFYNSSNGRMKQKLY
jgi:hypothetical protein